MCGHNISNMETWCFIQWQLCISFGNTTNQISVKSKCHTVKNLSMATLASFMVILCIFSKKDSAAYGLIHVLTVWQSHLMQRVPGKCMSTFSSLSPTPNNCGIIIVSPGQESQVLEQFTDGSVHTYNTTRSSHENGDSEASLMASTYKSQFVQYV